MANKIPEHIDELLWRVAETRDTDLTADFLRRYPAMRPQLATREAMVDALKGARPVPPIATTFTPSAALAPRRKLWLAPLAAGLLIGLAIASYQVVKFANAEPRQPEKKVVVVPQSPTPKPIDGRQIHASPSTDSRYAPGTAPRPEDPRNDDGLVVLKTDTSLFAALAAIKAKGVDIQLMPGLEDMPLTLAPNRDDGTLALEPLSMLQAVKAAGGFEMVDNGPEGILILPTEKTTVIGGEGSRIRTEDIDGGN
jgi:hypothetical protein